MISYYFLFVCIYNINIAIPLPRSFIRKEVKTMATELVSGAFLFAFVQTLFQRIATREMADFIRGVKHDNGPKLLDKLKISFRSVDALVNHAKERKTTNIHIRIG